NGYAVTNTMTMKAGADRASPSRRSCRVRSDTSGGGSAGASTRGSVMVTTCSSQGEAPVSSQEPFALQDLGHKGRRLLRRLRSLNRRRRMPDPLHRRRNIVVVGRDRPRPGLVDRGTDQRGHREGLAYLGVVVGGPLR